MTIEWLDDRVRAAERVLVADLCDEECPACRPTATETNEPGCPCVPGTP